ncbi:hypothetical protein HanXRQr2_Chr06g0259631 [Helianthus annuus]|uniref:Uncharacterized protein n=1 Tax=Helianthus annuus TaxID=4232 RepID=A0A251UI37_HELAN|nr:hypothetical protein HanXRQr2_Chr06g0259631 [Helianthus annuus]KAJ0915510.1 hypothetical protein HanPSC8_Chr06g0250631 [Helianthus annuus]
MFINCPSNRTIHPPPYFFFIFSFISSSSFIRETPFHFYSKLASNSINIHGDKSTNLRINVAGP